MEPSLLLLKGENCIPLKYFHISFLITEKDLKKQILDKILGMLCINKLALSRVVQ